MSEQTGNRLINGLKEGMGQRMEPIRWWQWSRKRHCPHMRVHGIYGDAINHMPGFRRNRCEDCRRLLDGPVSISEERSDLTQEEH